jgi:2-C-methyl-D-erythritol 2,4-cyclodiphosphate synthase
MSIRIGNGYDVHRLVKGRELILGGVHIPHEYGLLGHSDADVLLHAIMDAMLGAAGLGDIGVHFPDNKPEYKDISSLLLLKRVSELIEELGFSLINIDCVIIAQRPKMSKYFDKMREQISGCLRISESRLNIKATTEEGLGFTGREEGISAWAVCLLSEF